VNGLDFSAWWVLGIIELSILFLSLTICFIMSHYYLRAETAVYAMRTELDPNYLDSNELDATPMEYNSLYAPVVRIRRRFEFWSRLATRAYIALVVSSVAIYIVSMFPLSPPSPFWLIVLLQAYAFAGAYLTYKTWRKTKD
jgi:hypothetical protein